jgi:hypothetical protein
MPACLIKAMSTSASLAEARASPAVKTTWSSGFEALSVVLSRRAARLVSSDASSFKLQAWPEIRDEAEG